MAISGKLTKKMVENLGHENVMTTVNAYLQITESEKSAILEKLRWLKRIKFAGEG